MSDIVIDGRGWSAFKNPFNVPSLASVERSRSPPTHDTTTCNACGVLPIVGVRYHCFNSSFPNFDLYSECVDKGLHSETHRLLRMSVPEQFDFTVNAPAPHPIRQSVNHYRLSMGTLTQRRTTRLRWAYGHKEECTSNNVWTAQAWGRTPLDQVNRDKLYLLIQWYRYTSRSFLLDICSLLILIPGSIVQT